MIRPTQNCNESRVNTLNSMGHVVQKDYLLFSGASLFLSVRLRPKLIKGKETKELEQFRYLSLKMQEAT